VAAGELPQRGDGQTPASEMSTCTAVRIRLERPVDIPGIRAVNRAAFKTSTEADLVDPLRKQASPIVSLVAEDREAVIGHILFSPVTLTPHPEVQIMGLAPMSVVPARQRHGIGTALVREGLEQCRRSGFGAVIVLGHAEYYPRFGFRPASQFGLSCEYDVPDEVFMALELDKDILRGRSGRIRYHAAFASV
jgi:putative acetyltransferase